MSNAATIDLKANNSQVKRELQDTERSFQKFGSGVKKVALAIGAAFAANQLFRWGKQMFQLYAIQEQAEAKLGAVIKATGGAAGYTLEQMKEYAAQLQKVTTVGDEVILQGMTIISTFKNIKGDEFKAATKAATDMAGIFGSVTGASMQLGKALNNPKVGISALSRAGVDFSDEAVALAKSLSQELAIPARFIRSNIYDLPEVLDDRFDIVFTSYGVLCWLPDLRGWAQIAARYLKPGGMFYIVEFHPILAALADSGEFIELPYFEEAEPWTFDSHGSYADPDADFCHTSHEWARPLGNVVSGLIDAGLRIEFLHEFPYCIDGGFPFLERVEPGQFMIRGKPNLLPLMYSIRARKEA